MIRILVLHLCLFLSAFAGDISRLLPDKSEISPWRSTEPPRVYNGRQLFDYINGGAEIYLEYGFNQILSQEYEHGEDIIVVDIFEMDSAKAAFGIYSCNRNHRYPTLDIGDGGLIAEYQAIFRQDRYYVVVMGYKSDEKSQNVLKDFTRIIASKIHSHGTLPKVLELLPKEGKISFSECYITGQLGLNSRYYFSQKDIFEFKSGHVCAAYADYAFDKDEAALLLVSLKDTTQAKIVLQNLRQHYQEKYVNLQEIGELLLAADNKNRFFSVVRVNNIIVVILKASNKDICLKITNNTLQNKSRTN